MNAHHRSSSELLKSSFLVASIIVGLTGIFFTGAVAERLASSRCSQIRHQLINDL